MKIMDAEQAADKEHQSAQQQWNIIVESNHQAAKEVLGERKRPKSTNRKIQVLSARQKDIYNKINSTNKREDRKKLQKERNQTLTELPNH